ncbi:MAG: hypothetical protein HY062_03505 [Bacteroidetes bacterium]|nr:hypothetical protein [Bacteroidota bacterium]
MLKKIVILFLGIICNPMFAGDSLKIYPKWIIDVSYSQKPFLGGSYVSDRNKQQTQTTTSDKTDTYDLNLTNSISSNVQYCITKANKNANQLFIGLGINYSSGELNHTLFDHPLVSGHGSGSNISYSQHEFQFRFNSISVSPQMVYNVIFKGVVLTNKIGINYSNYFCSSHYDYQELTYNWGHDKDPAYITPSNPDGWYSYNILSSSVNKKDELPSISQFAIFYNMVLGVRIGKFMPSIGFEFCLPNYYNKSNYFYAKAQAGLAYLF